MKLWTTLTMLLLVAALTTLAGCSGADSGTDSVVGPRSAIDTAPPAVPTGLSATSGRSTVKLSWRPNTTDPDFQGFLVYRVAFDQTWPLNETPVQDPRYVDAAPLRGYAIYAVTSVDAQGNESAWTRIQYNYQPSDIAVTNR